MFVQIITRFGEPGGGVACLFRVQQTTSEPFLEALDFHFAHVAVFGRPGHLARSRERYSVRQCRGNWFAKGKGGRGLDHPEKSAHPLRP
jgi:hypothetical protein